MQDIQPPFSSFIYGLPNAGAKAYFICRDILPTASQTILVTENEAEDIVSAARMFVPENVSVLIFPPTDNGRIATLYKLLSSPKIPQFIITDYASLSAPLPTRQELEKTLLSLHRGQSVRRQELADTLEKIGYSREDYTESPGQYAMRGSVVDIFCPQDPFPTRLYFSGNRLEMISSFDPDTQNSKEQKDNLIVLPLAFEQTPALLADYVDKAEWLFDEPDCSFDFSAHAGARFITQLPRDGARNVGLKSPVNFQANMELAEHEIAQLHAQGYHVSVCCLNRGELDRISALLADKPHAGKVPLIISSLTQGFYSPHDKRAFITSNDLLNRRYNATRILNRFDVEGAKRIRFKELQAGDYVVHQEHGIGRYLGLEIMDKEENPTDCLIIEYRRGSRLYVPMYDFKKVQKYIGVGGKRPTLSVLGGIKWQEVKKHVKEEAQKTAREILKLEALRQATSAPDLPGDPRMEQEFADSFPYVLTPGQEQAISQTLHDLSLPKPMDRILVGDVGFGKTEVAMRAALKTALSGKQVLVLSPTTILTAQHYKTFTKRMAGFPVNVRMLCRFQTSKEQKEIIQEIKNGICDIIIGTHRLLSKDIVFKNLGLVIIDEEHRFGVKQKEKIRAKCAGVHSLMLSATPIPRTLNQSLSSLRDISLIDTPPRGRTPIQTVVTPWNKELVASAILREITRGGQVYYVYNSVQSMQSRELLLKKLVPHARICVAHGQMDEKELEQTLWDFNNGKYDVLLASTIIESGLDITNANTLMVENAHHFGLAQLYQLRGRIGRGNVKAYCYLFHPDWLFKQPTPQGDNFAELSAVRLSQHTEKDPTENAKQRLSALMEFSELGSGFRLALRDMEIRGAGELLGVKQHGPISEVGLNLYCDLVAAEVKKLRTGHTETVIRATVNLPLHAYIPPDYLPDEAERLKYYKALMSATPTQTQQLLARLADLCGPIPPEIYNLTALFMLSQTAGKLNIYHLDYIEGKLELLFAKHFHMPENFPAELFNRFGASCVEFTASHNGGGVLLTPPKGKLQLDFARETLTFLSTLLTPQK